MFLLRLVHQSTETEIPVSTRVSFTIRDRSGMMAVHTLVNVLMLTKDSTDVLRSVQDTPSFPATAPWWKTQPISAVRSLTAPLSSPLPYLHPSQAAPPPPQFLDQLSPSTAPTRGICINKVSFGMMAAICLVAARTLPPICSVAKKDVLYLTMCQCLAPWSPTPLILPAVRSHLVNQPVPHHW